MMETASDVCGATIRVASNAAGGRPPFDDLIVVAAHVL